MTLPLALHMMQAEDTADTRLAKEQRTLLAMRAARIYLWEWDIARDEIVWLDGLESELQVAEAPRNGAEFARLVHPDDLSMVNAKIGEALVRGNYEAEFRMIRADGSVRWSLTHAIVVRDHAGQPIRMVGCDQDITDRRKIQQELIESEAKLRAIGSRLLVAQTASGVGVWDWDIDAQTFYVSDVYRDIYGLPPEGVVRRSAWLARVAPQDRARVENYGEDILRGGDRYDIEFRIIHPTRGQRWIAGIGGITRDAKGRATRFSGVSIDITDRKLRDNHPWAAFQSSGARDANAPPLQADLAQSQRLEAIGRLTSGVAHDFNNFIAAMSSAFAQIERRTSDREILEIAGHGREAALRSANLVKQLLSFTRQQNVAPEGVSLSSFVIQVGPVIRQALAPGIQLSIRNFSDLPAVQADSTLLEMSLLNLAVNAGDAMPNGGDLVIEARVCPVDDPHRPKELADVEAVEISVRDNGAGIPEDILGQVVEPFFTTKGPGRGTGLGLAMVNGFAHQSGGALRIDSLAGIGTTVRLFLPVCEQARTKPGSILPNAEVLGHGKTVLLIESDEQARRTVGEQLRELGHRVIEAADEVAAMAACRLSAEFIDLAIADLGAGGNDGSALAETLRALGLRAPVLHMSDASCRGRAGSEDAIERPFSTASLARIIEAAECAPRVHH